MKITNHRTLKKFRAKKNCECCGDSARGESLDPHHCFVKCGSGSGSRLDVSINLIALRRTCHMLAEADRQFNLELRNKIADREGESVEDIEAVLALIRWTPKGDCPTMRMSDLSERGKALLYKVLEEMDQR